MTKEQSRSVQLNLRSYAKINLSLDVTGVRDDGYHLLETVMQQVSLYDDIGIRWEPDSCGELKITVTNSKPYLPVDSRNLAYKAALVMAEQAESLIGKRPRGVLKIHIEKRIPVAAGLGGGSGNAAAMVIGLNRLWEMKIDTPGLCAIGTLLGADVPFCILTQNSRYTCALGTGIGEVLTPVKPGMKKHIVIAKPAFGVSTKEVFREIDRFPSSERPDTQELIKGLKQGDMDRVYPNMINILENYTLKCYPEVQTLKDRMSAAGDAEKVLMSGSGPTVMAIYNNYGSARRACLEIRRHGYEAYWAHTGKEIRGERNDKL